MATASSSHSAWGDAVSVSDLPDLLEAVARGDQAAFSSLYDTTAARVHGLVVRVLADPAQSEEVTQEVFLEVWRTASRFDRGRGSPLGWLLTIAHRRAVDRVRASSAARARDVTYERETTPASYDTTEETVSARLDAERVRAAMVHLTDMQREAVELAYFGGRTHTEIAATLGIPLGTAKSRIRDGLTRLRDHIGGER
ncbi:ECF RNA polymerase sigma factor SigK [Luteipulveratus mongoliensis]|uniref:RNA polymerase sigma factor SigK n=1 Tax=Luteipulveratus mongoliensis TaxID=571913 RepID=A0A0K1JRH0_9MICO|nr:RNA polymerase sigma factor SigK [Luteipulveratus mongoliensis]